VDRYLSEQGRLVLIENVGDIETKIKLARRNGAVRSGLDQHAALQTIVNFIVGVIEPQKQPAQA